MEKLWLMQAAVRSCVLSEILKGHFVKGNFNSICNVGLQFQKELSLVIFFEISIISNILLYFLEMLFN